MVLGDKGEVLEGEALEGGAPERRKGEAVVVEARPPLEQGPTQQRPAARIRASIKMTTPPWRHLASAGEPP